MSKTIYTKAQQARIKITKKLEVEIDAEQAAVKKQCKLLKTKGRKYLTLLVSAKPWDVYDPTGMWHIGYEPHMTWTVLTREIGAFTFDNKEEAEKFIKKHQKRIAAEKKHAAETKKQFKNNPKCIPVPPGYKLVKI